MGAASSEKTLHLKSAGPQAQGPITPSDPPGTRPSQHPRGLQKPLRQLTGSEGTFSGSRALATPPPACWPRTGAESRAGCTGPTSSAPAVGWGLSPEPSSSGPACWAPGPATHPTRHGPPLLGKGQVHPRLGPRGQKAKGCHRPAPGKQPQVPSPILQTESAPVQGQCPVLPAPFTDCRIHTRAESPQACWARWAARSVMNTRPPARSRWKQPCWSSKY